MKLKHRETTKSETLAKKPEEPLSEGIRRTERGRDWRSMSDGEVAEHAKRFTEEKGITGRGQLRKADESLYHVLSKRRLLDKMGLESKKANNRDWSSMSDDELVAHAKSFMEEKGITSRWELQKEDKGLYFVLWGRNLLGRLGLENKNANDRDWSQMGDDKLVEHARRFIEEKKTTGRKQLRRADKGLYHVLWDRNLLARVFAPIEREKQVERTRGIAEFMDGFGSSDDN